MMEHRKAMARTARNLTRKTVEDALKGKLEPGRRADGQGLYLNIRRGGSAQWVVLKMQDGKRVEKSLGSVMTMGLTSSVESTNLGRIAGASLEAARLALADVLIALKSGATMKSLRKIKTPKVEKIEFTWDSVAATYRKLKGPLSEIAERGLTRNIGNFQKVNSEVKDIRELEKRHARRWRDQREADKVSPQTIDREVSILRAALNLFYNEYDLKLTNPFSGLIIKGKATKGSGKNKRARDPFTISEMHKLRKVCYDTSKTPDLGAMFDVICMTGARLAEISKLQPEDVFLDHDIPHIRIRPTDERGIKTEGSERLIPIYGHGHIALSNALERNKKTGWVFGKRIGEQSPNSTSAILAKKKDKVTTDPKKAGAHSCRHSISDALKAALVPKELRDALTGHVSGTDIAENTYGSVAAQLKAMNEAMKPVLTRYSENIVKNNDPEEAAKVATLNEFLE